jgi:hypothetical protein
LFRSRSCELGFGGHFEGQAFHALLAVVLVRSGDGVVGIDTVEGGGVGEVGNLGFFVGARGGGVFGGAFADRF